MLRASCSLVLIFIALATSNLIERNRNDVRKFPDGFLFGTATSAYQIEGAWDVDGKGESIWDYLTHTNPCATDDCTNADIATDSYNKLERDIQIIRELGVDFYRFSLAWTRILPDSFSNKVNEAGVQYYNNLINELLKYNIEPMLTLYHWDLPQKLQEMGGWTNPNIVDWFGDYARTAFQLFGDRVKNWITINEPHNVCYHGYGSGGLAPRVNATGVSEYICAKNLLLAHARAYHIYDQEFRPSGNGVIYMSFSAEWYDAEFENETVAADDANQFVWQQYSHPVFSESGGFPPAMRERIDAKSAEQGYPRSRLPEFTPEERDYVKGTSDRFGLNHYATLYVTRNKSVPGYYKVPSFDDDLGLIKYRKSEWTIGESDFVPYVPWGFYKLLTSIKNLYNNIPVVITENGFPSRVGFGDDDRVTYYRGFLDAMLDAIEDGCDIRGYTAWSMMDNFEWEHGYIVLIFVALSKSNLIERNRYKVREFPDGFLFGTATSAYQIEGAWDEDGKAESIWDHLTHTNPCVVDDCSNGDVAANSYHKIERDVEMLRELGVDFYRFSLAWTRILPNSFSDKVSEAGVQYYHNLINELLKYNIEPMVTLYHWDLPQKLQEMGGWTNPNIVDWFGDYARTAFQLFGDRVKNWITINEPYNVCYHGYGNGRMAPGVNATGVSEYICAKNVLLAHAKAYHIYDKEFRPSENGVIYMSFSSEWFDTEFENETIAAAEANQFVWQQYSYPIFSESGGFPPAMIERIDAKSAEQGYPRSRLPEFTPEERDYVKGTSDRFGLNHYGSLYVTRNESVTGYYNVPSFDDDLGVITYKKSEWKIGESNFVQYVPWGFYKLLTNIRDEYNNPPVIITENGFSSRIGLEDADRITYYRGYLNAMLDAIEDGCDVRAYTAWSMMDNFEWNLGYVERFGLYEIDYEDPERPRTPRKSAFIYKEIIRTRSLDSNYEPPADAVMKIDERH